MFFTIAVAVFVLGVLILVHESGHFLAAKLVNIQVLRFSIGLGRSLISRRWGETEYSISAIPFGGYVKMAGDDPAEGLEGSIEESRVAIDPRRHFDKKSVPARALVILAGPLMNLLLAMVLFVWILYFQGAETYSTTKVETVEKSITLPGLERIKEGSQIIRVNNMEVKNWRDITDGVINSLATRTTFDLYDSQDRNPYSVSVSTPDDSTRLLLAVALVPLVEPRISGTIPGKPAAKAGMQAGDLILSINGKPVKSWREVTGIVHASAGVELDLLVDRGGEKINFPVIPEKNTLPQNDNTFKEVGLIGIRPPMERINLNLAESVISGSKNSIYTTYFIATRLGQLFMGFITGKIPLKEARNVLGGPVMIGQYAGESARTGDLWAFMAILSINLFILNLLPIPVLDGGHLLFLAIEVVRFGKPLSVKQRMWLIQVGLLIVLALMLLATANDLGRLFGF